ncbi:MerR family DNA-binding transcriptional regulator [Streptomyces mirabilis]|uniref:MerR family DNA-binding transcriptional regulator n=1 Tax=Streptomyces mirabilis TaxID=68239 RepID=UPI0036D8589D
MRIGEAATAAGTTPRALRFYEQRGLLPPPARTTSGQREDGPGEITQVRVSRDLLALGLTIEDLRSCADRLHLLAQDRRGGGLGVSGHGVRGVPGSRPRPGRAREPRTRWSPTTGGGRRWRCWRMSGRWRRGRKRFRVGSQVLPAGLDVVRRVDVSHG